MTIYQTARLRIRELRPDDFDHMYRLMSDPDIMRYIRAPDTDPAVVQDRIDKWSVYHAAHPKLGVFIVEMLDTAEFAGYCVLRHVNFEPGKDLEIGYAIDHGFAGKGLATELAGGLADYLFEVFQPEKIVAFIDPANAASQRVLEKNGFQITGKSQTNNVETVVFERYK